MTKSIYRNSRKSESAIKDSLMALLRDGHYLGDISIKEICAKADVTRGTFYNHYSDINAVVKDIEDDFVEELTIAIKESGWEEKKRKGFFDKLTIFLEEKAPLFTSIIKVLPLKVFNDIRTKLNQSILQIVSAKDECAGNNQRVRARILLFVNGLAGAYLESVTGTTNISIRDISDVAYQLTFSLFD